MRTRAKNDKKCADAAYVTMYSIIAHNHVIHNWVVFGYNDSRTICHAVVNQAYTQSLVKYHDKCTFL